jgi:hypothetical protein
MLLAALGVFGTSTGWPDVSVAAVIAVLALHGSWQVIQRQGGSYRPIDALPFCSNNLKHGGLDLIKRNTLAY